MGCAVVCQALLTFYVFGWRGGDVVSEFGQDASNIKLSTQNEERVTCMDNLVIGLIGNF